MPEVDNYIREFQDRVDKNARVVSGFSGDFGIISRLMFNSIENIFYDVHYRRAWFGKFGKLFATKIPKEDQMVGTSVTIEQLKRHYHKKEAYIALIYENQNDHARMIYGCDVKKWMDYVTKYHTLHIKKEIDNLTEGCIPLKLLFNMEGFKNK